MAKHVPSLFIALLSGKQSVCVKWSEVGRRTVFPAVIQGPRLLSSCGSALLSLLGAVLVLLVGGEREHGEGTPCLPVLTQKS